MKKIVSIVVLSIYAASLHAIKSIALDFPLIIKNNLAGETALKMRESEKELQDTKLDSEVTADPITSLPLDNLFDEADSPFIIVAGAITTDKDKSYVHYFDANALKDNLVSRFPKNFPTKTFPMLKNAYQNPNDQSPQGIQFYLSNQVPQGWQSLFFNPVNKSKIRSLLFYKIDRTKKEDGSLTYSSEYLGDEDQVGINTVIGNAFKKFLESNNVSVDKIRTKVYELYSKQVTAEEIQSLEQNLALIKDKVEEKDFKKLQDLLKAGILIQQLKYQEALPYLESSDDPKAQGLAVIIRLGYMSTADQKEQEKGFAFLHDVVQKIKGERYEFGFLNNIAIILNDRAKTPEEYAYVRTLLEPVAKSKPGDIYYGLNNKMVAMFQIGKSYYREGKFDKKYFAEALKYFSYVIDQLAKPQESKYVSLRLLTAVYKAFVYEKLNDSKLFFESEKNVQEMLKKAEQAKITINHGTLFFIYLLVIDVAIERYKNESIINNKKGMLQAAQTAYSQMQKIWEEIKVLKEPFVFSDFRMKQLQDYVQKRGEQLEKLAKKLQELEVQEKKAESKKRKSPESSGEEPLEKKEKKEKEEPEETTSELEKIIEE